MDFKLPKIKIKRPIKGLSWVRPLIGFFVRNRSFLINRARLRKKEYLDIGCGLRIHKENINLDYVWRWGLDICWDVTRGIPLKGGSVKGIFTEHSLEHYPFEAGVFVLGECLRVLRPGGSLRIIVPDGELYMTIYSEIINDKKDREFPISEDDGHEGIYSPIMSVNRIFRHWEHQYIYDFDLLRQLLERAGFVDIKREGYMTSRDLKLLLDTEWRKVESLYIEASKP